MCIQPPERCARKGLGRKPKRGHPITIGELRRSDFELDNQIADIAYLKKELLNIGIMPSQVDQEDMVDLLEVLRAKPREERPQPVDEAFANLEKMMNQ